MEKPSNIRYLNAMKLGLSVDLVGRLQAMRARIARTLVAVLVGTLFVPIGSIGITPILDQAHAVDYTISCSNGGSFVISSSQIPAFAGGNCSGIATIPLGVTSMAGNAFAKSSPSASNRGLVTGVVFPASGFTEIGASAFQYTNLISINIPSSVTTIGAQAFANNPSFTSATLAGTANPAIPLNTSYYLFNENTAFTTLNLGSGAMNINWLMFAGANNLATISGGGGVISIGPSALSGTKITSFPFTSTVTSIGEQSFQNTKLTSISLPCGLNSIGPRAFQGITTLTSVQMCADTGTAYSNFTIGANAFAGATNLQSFSFGASLARTVNVKTWNDDPDRVWAGATSLKWIQYCGTGAAFETMTAHLVTPYIPTGVTVSCSEPSANLSNLVLSSGTLTPSFSSNTETYTASVANSISSGYVVSATKTFSNATAVQYVGATGTTSFNGELNVGPNIIRTVVTAADGITKKTYTVTVTRLSPPPTFSGLNPTLGPTSGGTTVTLTGTNLESTTTVSVGGSIVTPESKTATAVTIKTPIGSVGTKDVVVTTPGGSVTLAGGFAYQLPQVTCKDSNGLAQSISANETGVVASYALASCFDAVTIGAGVTRLSAGAFLTSAQYANNANPQYPRDFNTKISKITFAPTGFTTLDAYSLAQLTSVSYVALPNSVVSLADNVLSRSQIQTLDMSAYIGNYTGVTIGTSVFSNATLPEYIRDCTAQSAVPGSSLAQTRFGGSARSPAVIFYCAPETTKTLSALEPSAGTLSPSFSRGTTTYAVTVPNATSSIAFTATSDSASSSIHVNGILQKSGSSGFYFNPGSTIDTFTLQIGVNNIFVVVTPQDQGTVNTYTVQVTRMGLPQETLTVNAGSTSAVIAGSSFSATPNLSTSGGTGSGAITYSATNGTATGCSLSSSTSPSATLSALSSGTCLITATKARSGNYEAATSAAIAFTFTKARLIPIFDTASATSTSTGFTLRISNYDAAFTWNKSNSLGATTTISAQGVITVSGLNPAIASTVTITTTRAGYDSATATSLSYSSLTGAAKVATFGTATRTSDGFTLPITNYETLTTWSVTNSLGKTASINSSTGLITVTGVNPGTASTVTVVTTRTGYETGTATSPSYLSLTGAAKTPQYGTATPTADGFTLQITNYETATTWSVTNSLGKSASINSSSGLITVTGVNPGTASTVTVVTTRTGYETGTATSPSYASLTGAGKIALFGTATSTASGFTLEITNYETATSWSVTNSLGKTATINSTTGLITVTGVNPGTASTVTVTTTRTGYETGTATSSAYSSNIGAAKIPVFETATVIQTADGFQLRISNFEVATTWSASHSLGKSVAINTSTGWITVSGVNPGTASTVTITTTRTGYDTGTATSASYSSLTGGAKVPLFGTATATLDGFTLPITNYETVTAWSVTNSLGKPTSINSSTGLITVTGMPSGTASTVTVTTTRVGYETGTATSASISSASAATQPTNVSATVAARSAVVSWTAPGSTGGSAITDYVIEYSSTNGETWTAFSHTASTLTQITVTGLLDGTAYLYRVAAVNAVGQSPFTTSTSVRTAYYVACTSGSFWVAGPSIPSRAGQSCTGTATIPQGITGVATNAFAPGTGGTSTNRGLTSIVFPASGFEEIGLGGFMNLGLTTLTIPGSVRSVGQYGFQNNPLTSVTITGGSGGASTLLKDSVFGNASLEYGLSTQIALTLGAGKIDLADNFGSNTRFSTVDFGPALNSIGVNVFKANSIQEGWIPIFPSTITSIGAGAFTQNPRMRTIRFGSSTTSSITSINENAFDKTNIKSVQYCGPESTVLGTYIKNHLKLATVWCDFVAPNAPTITSSSKTNQRVTIDWTKGATLNEPPTDTFTVQYQVGSDAWTSVPYDTTTPLSRTIGSLTNGTTYKLRVAANNIAGTSSFSNVVEVTPLGLARTPIMDTSTATASGFTFNVTNYDSSTVWSAEVTAGSGTVTLGTPSGTTLPVTVSNMTSGATSSVQLMTTRTNYETGTTTTAGTSLNAALTPTFGAASITTSGYTVPITNFDSNYSWSVVSSSGSATIVNDNVVVTGASFATLVIETVTATRNSYVTGRAAFSATTLAALTATYFGNGSTAGSPPTDSTSYQSNATLVVLGESGTLVNPGYTFGGWNLNSANTGPTYQTGDNYVLANTAVSFYAKWIAIPYTVTYNLTEATSGSVPTDSGSYTISTIANIRGNSGNLLRTGYEFAGWRDNADRTGRNYVSGDTYTVQAGNVNLFAAWTPKTYSISFNRNGATGDPSKSSDSYTVDSETVQVATVGTMVKSGYDFGGWATQAVGTALPDSITVAENTTLYAQWNIASFILTYNLDGGTGSVPAPSAVPYLSQFNLPSSSGLTRSAGDVNYAFVSWQGPSASYNAGQSYYMPAGDLSFTAIWTPIYNVKYSYSGGTVATPIPDDQKIEGETIIISDTAPTRAGYRFTGWADQSGESTTAGAVYTVRPDHYLLYAQWEIIPYAVLYDAAGGSPAPTESSKTIGQSFTIGAAPSKTGYDFMGWNDGTSTYAPGSPYVTQDSNITLTAQWQAQTYLVTYDLNGGSGSAGGNYTYTYATSAYTLPTSGFSLTDYSFGGWATSIGGPSVGTTFAPSANVTLYAIWNIAIYRVNFDAGAGFVDTATAKVTIGQSLILPIATRTNYTLQGWSTEQSGGTLTAGGASFTPASNTNLFAQWALQIFTVTYDGNGGVSDTPTASIASGTTTPIVLPAATRLNYVLNGWYSASTGGYLIGAAGANYLPSSSLTIYAQWTQNSLVGLGQATKIAEVIVDNQNGNTFTAGSGGSTATVDYTAGGLPDGTVITAYVQSSTNQASSLIDPDYSYVLSLVVAWVAPDGTVPDTADGKPIVLTIANSAITKGSRIYKVVGTNSRILGTATEDGRVEALLTQDPLVTVAITEPDSVTAVTAISLDESSAFVSWEAPAVTGGSAITNYEVTSNAGQSCSSVTTTCTVNGLAPSTSYTFTVIARNSIGASVTGIPSSSVTTSASTAPPVVVNPGPTPETVVFPIVVVPAPEEVLTPPVAPVVTPTPTPTPEVLPLPTEDPNQSGKSDKDVAAENAQKQALEDAARAAAEIVPAITIYSITEDLTLSDYNLAYLRTYIETLKPNAMVTCIGYTYTAITTLARATALAKKQANALCAIIKQERPTLTTTIEIRSAESAPPAAPGAQWVAVSYRVDSYEPITPTKRYQTIQTGLSFLAYMPTYTASLTLKKIEIIQCSTNKNYGMSSRYGSSKKSIVITEYRATNSCSLITSLPKGAKRTIVTKNGTSTRPGARISLVTAGLTSLEIKKLTAGLVRVPIR